MVDFQTVGKIKGAASSVLSALLFPFVTSHGSACLQSQYQPSLQTRLEFHLEGVFCVFTGVINREQDR